MNFNRACAHILRAQQLLQFGASHPGFGTSVDYSNLIVAIDFDGTLTILKDEYGRRASDKALRIFDLYKNSTEVNRQEKYSSKLFGRPERRTELQEAIDYFKGLGADCFVYTRSKDIDAVKEMLEIANFKIEVDNPENSTIKSELLADMTKDNNKYAILFDDTITEVKTSDKTPHVYTVHVDHVGAFNATSFKENVEKGLRHFKDNQKEANKQHPSNALTTHTKNRGISRRAQNPSLHH